MKQTIEWHSVDEMLPDLSGLMPDEGEYVLIRYKYHDQPVGSGNAYITMGAYTHVGWDSYDNYGSVDPKLYTHWAYLPDANDGEFERKAGRSE